MGFLAPFFLLGGLLVALPVILHLTRRRREPVAFPSFLLLPAASAAARWKRRRFRNLPLLLLRCLALLLLAAAFAQPLIETGAAETPEQAPLDLAVLLDRSLSMSLSSRMEEAQRAAGEELDRLGGRDRAAVVAFSDQAEALTELTREAPILRSAVSGITAGPGGTGFASALGLAGRLLPATAGRRREVVLISDLQRSGFEDGRPRPSLPPGVGLRVRRIGGAPPDNAWVREVRVAAEGRGQIVVTAELGFAPSPSVPERAQTAALLLAGRLAERRPVRLLGERTLTVRFAPVVRPSEPLAAEVRLETDALSGDDGFRFVIPPETAIPVADLGGGGGFVYVREALGVGLSPAFAIERAPTRGETALRRALRGSRVALVRGPGALDGGAARALGEFVAAGGGLVVAMGPRRIPGAAAGAWSEILPAAPAGFVDRDPAGRFADFSARHPIFEPFVAGAAAALAGPAFFRYRALTGIAPDALALARFDDGRPAILAAERGQGLVLLFASSFDAAWNDLPRRAAFVPFLHRLIEVAAGHEQTPLAYRVGESVDIGGAFGLPPPAGEAAVAAGEVLIEAPSGERSVLADAAALRLAETGFFRARRPGSSVFREIAVNAPLPESDLRALDEDEVRIGAAPSMTPAGDGEDPSALRRAGFGAWWLLLAGLLALLAVETRAANTTPGTARSYTGG